MPKYKANNKKLKAKLLAKTCLKNNLNNAKTARQLGVTKQAIQQQVNTPEVQDALQVYLDSADLKDKLIKKADEGLEANKIISANITYGEADEKTDDFIEVPDHNARHRYWHDLMQILGKLKPVGTPNIYDTKIIQLIVKNDKNKPLLKRIKGDTK